MSWLYFLLIGALAGWLAGQLTRGKGFGIIGNIVVGVIGALLGGFVFRELGFISYGFIASLVTATVGAILLLWVVRFLK